MPEANMPKASRPRFRLEYCRLGWRQKVSSPVAGNLGLRLGLVAGNLGLSLVAS